MQAALFVPDDLRVDEALVQLAHDLGLRVVARAQHVVVERVREQHGRRAPYRGQLRLQRLPLGVLHELADAPCGQVQGEVPRESRVARGAEQAKERRQVLEREPPQHAVGEEHELPRVRGVLDVDPVLPEVAGELPRHRFDQEGVELREQGGVLRGQRDVELRGREQLLLDLQVQLLQPEEAGVHLRLRGLDARHEVAHLLRPLLRLAFDRGARGARVEIPPVELERHHQGEGREVREYEVADGRQIVQLESLEERGLELQAPFGRAVGVEHLGEGALLLQLPQLVHLHALVMVLRQHLGEDVGGAAADVGALQPDEELERRLRALPAVGLERHHHQGAPCPGEVP
mmetsp:Transcript_80126/g.226831  ORF Transcript_80126/g.226831 Transcript_80126/m.226831 type:complete len:346 (-) Transcript_80126:1220-2257(-)